MVGAIHFSNRQELTVGVGERPEYLDEQNGDGADSEGRGANGKRGRRRQNGRRRSAADRTREDENAGGVAVEREVPERRGERPERRSSRERALTRLLAGLRAMDAGDFSVRLDPDGDPLMAELILAYNNVASRHKKMTY
jgi:hypothetical protein